MAYGKYGIDTISKRRKLEPRREPYWHKLGAGEYLGYRKTEQGGGWIARIRLDDKQRYNALRDVETFEEASKAARTWFKEVRQTPTQNSRYTVKQAVDDYVDHLKVAKGDDPSTRTKQMLEKHLVPKLGKIELPKLTHLQVKRWRDGLVRTDGDEEDTRKSKDSANRIMSSAKAAFNLAHANGVVASNNAWVRVKAFQGVGSSRKVFLTGEQITRLKEVTSGGFKRLIEAAILTGARYGELTAVKVRDFDRQNGTLHLNGKTGPRDCYLSKEGLTFMKESAKGRLPEAFLFVRDDGDPWKRSQQLRPMDAAVKAAKLPAGTVFYSLRHYHISKALLAGIPAQIVAENTGTSIRMLEKHYAKFMKSDRRKMMDRVVL